MNPKEGFYFVVVASDFTKQIVPFFLIQKKDSNCIRHLPLTEVQESCIKVKKKNGKNDT